MSEGKKVYDTETGEIPARLERQRGALRELALACNELASRLGNKGRPLTSEEEVLIRQAMLPALKEALDEVGVQYVMGVPIQRILEKLDNTLLNL